MSGDYDDDFWENDDFIATIENLAKKAEEASAERHGGTQSAPTPLSGMAARPSLLASGVRTGEESGEIGASFQLRESLVPQPRIGSSAAAHGGAFSRGGHDGNPPVGTADDPSGRVRVPFPSLAEQRLQTDGRAFHESSSGDGRRPRGACFAVEDSEQLQELIAEKDGAISNLRFRARQAEQQLDDLRKRIGPQSAPQCSQPQQQLELERLTAQLLFKEHEVTQAQRAHAEKEDLLKVTLAESAALREELALLKKTRPTSAESQHPWHEGNVDAVKKSAEKSELAPALPQKSWRSTTGVSMHNRDPWVPPWVPETSSGRATVKSNVELHGENMKDAAAGVGLSRKEDDSVEDPQLRTKENGYRHPDQNKYVKSDQTPATDQLRRDSSRAGGTSTSAMGDADGGYVVRGMHSYTRTKEMYYSIQKLWGLRGVKNDGVSLLSKLYASCRQDLYILLSSRAQHFESLHYGIKKEAERGTPSEELHTAIAKVANGLALPEAIITALLEFCKLDDVTLAASALHIFRCILHHDRACRQRLLSRRCCGDMEELVSDSDYRDSLEEPGRGSGRHGWFLKNVPKEGGTGEIIPMAVFSSPRVRCHGKSGNVSVQHAINEEHHMDARGAEIGHEPPMPSHRVRQPAVEDKEKGPGDIGLNIKELNIAVQWMLQMALTTSSRNIKFEAVAIIGVLVLSSEPLMERAMFGPLLCYAGMDLFLKDVAEAEIQVQAVRIVHLLLRCPSLFQKFCAKPESDNAGLAVAAAATETETNLKQKARTCPLAAGHSDDMTTGKDRETSKTTVSANEQVSYGKLLESLTDCLRHRDINLQGYVLRRSVIRLLTFIATAKDSGAAFLLRAGATFEDREEVQACKDDPKLEGVGGGESASGQQIGGGTSDSNPLRRLELGDKGIEIPITVVGERVDDSEQIQNIPQRLLALLDTELDISEREERTEQSVANERENLVCEAAMLLCRLSAHRIQSPVVVGNLISNKHMVRMTLSVMNRLIMRKSSPRQGEPGKSAESSRNFELAELVRGLRTRVLTCLAESR